MESLKNRVSNAWKVLIGKLTVEKPSAKKKSFFDEIIEISGASLQVTTNEILIIPNGWTPVSIESINFPVKLDSRTNPTSVWQKAIVGNTADKRLSYKDGFYCLEGHFSVLKNELIVHSNKPVNLTILFDKGN